MRPKVTALPREWIKSKYKLIEDGKLHPKRRQNVTRRDMTEMKIQQNIKDFNAPSVEKNNSDIYIGYRTEQRDFSTQDSVLSSAASFQRSGSYTHKNVSIPKINTRLARDRSS